MAAPLLKERRAECERRAWELRQQLKTLREIAAELGVSEMTVSRMLRKVEARLAGEFQDQAERVKARQTGQLEHIAREALAAWARSTQDAESETVTTGLARVTREGDVVPLPDQVVRKRQGQSGDAQLLARALDALAAVRALWGLQAPVRQEVSGPDGGPVEVATLSYEQALRLVREEPSEVPESAADGPDQDGGGAQGL